MKYIFLILSLVITASAFGQKNTYKAAGVPYTKGTPNWTPARATEGEFAIDSLTGKWWQYSFQTGTWQHLGYWVAETGIPGAPTYTPNKVTSVMAINSGDSLYHYRGGQWRLIFSQAIASGLSDGDKGDIDVTSSGAVWTIDTNAVTSIKIADYNVTLPKISQGGATTGQVLKWNGTTWAPDTDNGAAGGGIYGISDTVTNNHTAVIDSGLTFTSSIASSKFHVTTDATTYGTGFYVIPDSVRIRRFDIGGSTEIRLISTGILLFTTSPDRVTIQGADARYSADYRGTYDSLSIIHKDYGDDFYLQYVDSLFISGDTLYTSLARDSVAATGVSLATYKQTLSVDSATVGAVERFAFTISNGNTVYIDVPASSGSGVGQNNVGANLGSGTGVYAGKTDTTLNFKSFVEGYGIDITSTSTEITIKADTGQLATLSDVASVRTIYADTGTVAGKDDFLLRLRADTTFSIGHTNTNGFDDYWTLPSPTDYFQGVYWSPVFWGGVGLGNFTFDPTEKRNYVEAFPDLVRVGSEASERENNAIIVIGAEYNADTSLISFQFNRNGDFESYNFPVASPSVVNGDTTIMAWVGDGADHAPIGFVPYRQNNDTQDLSIDSTTIGGIERFTISLTNSPSVSFDVSNTVGTVTSVGITAPAAGITVSGSPVTSSGNMTLTLANDLAGVEGLSTTGIAARTGDGTWATRTLSTTASASSFVGVGTANMDGVSGNPTITLNTNVATNKLFVQAVATTNLDLNGTETIDGVSISAGQRVLVAGQSTASQNGIYDCASGAWTRSGDADAASKLDPGILVAVKLGTTYGATYWKLDTKGPFTVGTTALTFSQVFAAAGTVTSFSAGDLSPLFTTTESTVTTTPALSFSLSNAGANTYFGNATGSTAAPSYTAAGALTKVDDTNITLTLGGNPGTSLLRDASITAGWTGQLGVSRGGTGVGTLASNGVLYGNGTGAVQALAVNSGTKQFLSQASSAAPAWSSITASDIGSGAALTKVDDTNVTLTLGGSPSTSLLSATSLTLGWTGQLGVSRGGTGASTLTGLLQGNGTGAFTAISNSSTVGQTLRVTGASTYAWGALDLADGDAITGNLPVANLNSGTSASSATFWRGDGTWATPIGATDLTIGGSGPTYTIESSTGADVTVSGSGITLSESPANTLVLTATDPSLSNEGSLTASGTDPSIYINSNTSGSSPIQLNSGDGIFMDRTGNAIDIYNTGVLGSGNADQVPVFLNTNTVGSSPAFKYETNTLSLNPAARDTHFVINETTTRKFGIQAIQDTFNSGVNAWKIGALNRSGRIYLTSEETYIEGPLKQVTGGGIPFAGTTGSMFMHMNGDFYQATTTGANATHTRNMHWYFTSGGINNELGNPIVFQHIYEGNDTTGNCFEFLARNIASGGITHPDSTLFRVGNWDRGTALEIKHRGRIGIGTKSPSYTLDISATDGIRIPVGNTSERPSGATGVVRYNTDSTGVEYHNGSTWVMFGSGGGGGGGVTDHGALTGLSDDDHTQYALLAGRSSGQTLTGGTASGDDLVLRSTTNATKGDVSIQDQGGNVIIGGAATASTLRFMEPSGSGSNYTELTTAAQGSNQSYIWPTDSPSNGDFLQWTTGGQLAWTAGGGGGGEANTASNVGSGSGWYKQKTGVDLEFKSLVAGGGITVTSNTSDLTVATTAPQPASSETIESSNFTATMRRINLVDCSAGTITVTPPSSPSIGDRFAVVDAEATADDNNITIDFDTANQKLYSVEQNYIINVAGGYVEFIYMGSTTGWVATKG